MRASGEGVAVTPLIGVENLFGAGRAEGGIGRDFGAGTSAPALNDAEARRQIEVHMPAVDPLDPGQRRRFLLQPGDQARDGRLVARNADKHAFTIIENLARQPKFARQTPNRWAKAYPLDTAAHAYFHRDRRTFEKFDRRGNCHATSHRRMRLLPESATIAVLPQVAMP
jgi:hypothetical protein